MRRPGRLTPAQQRALDQLLPRYQIAADCTDLHQAFEGPGALVVEIGFGNGQALLEMAAQRPDQHFVGVEVHEPGVGRLLLGLEAENLKNVRVAMVDAVALLQGLRQASVDEVRIYFPDPWPKKRHHKRRLIQTEFLALLARVIRPAGRLHVATDWAPYAEHIVEVFEAQQDFTLWPVRINQRPEWRPKTHFERRGERAGHTIFDLIAERGGERG